MNIRTFLALELDEPAREALRQFQASLEFPGLDVRRVQPENMHLTLRFFGDITPQDIANISEAMSTIAHKESPFHITISGLGAFPSPERPKVVWAGLENPLPVVALEHHVSETLKHIGWPPEHKVFHPHITLARIRGGRAPRTCIETVRRWSSHRIARLYVDHIALIKSDLRPTGPLYTLLERFSFSLSTS